MYIENKENKKTQKKAGKANRNCTGQLYMYMYVYMLYMYSDWHTCTLYMYITLAYIESKENKKTQKKPGKANRGG